MSTWLTAPGSLADFSDLAVRSGIFYDPRVIDGMVGPTVWIDGREHVNFASINFLQCPPDDDALEHFVEASRTYGLSTGGSRMTMGVSRAHHELEEVLRDQLCSERALTFASGLLANFGFVTAMNGMLSLSESCQVDLRDVSFVLDRDCHWSLWRAVSHLERGRQVLVFRHNDMDHLEHCLEQVGGGRAVVVFESVYSSDGSVARIAPIIDLCERFGAVSFVDDANGFLIYGPSNRPFADEFSHIHRATFRMITLSKSVGLEGGALAGPAPAIRAFEVFSGTSSFTAAMQPPTASTATMLIRKLSADGSIVDGYLDRVARFRACLEELGCRLNETPSYITSVYVGDDEIADRIRREFEQLGFAVPVFRYPAVKRNDAILRLILNAKHTEEHIGRFMDALASMKAKYRF